MRYYLMMNMLPGLHDENDPGADSATEAHLPSIAVSVRVATVGAHASTDTTLPVVAMHVSAGGQPDRIIVFPDPAAAHADHIAAIDASVRKPFMSLFLSFPVIIQDLPGKPRGTRKCGREASATMSSLLGSRRGNP